MRDSPTGYINEKNEKSDIDVVEVDEVPSALSLDLSDVNEKAVMRKW